MSADQALTRAQERKNSKIDAAITAGRVAQLQKSMNVTLKLTSGGSMRLVSADGTASPEGRHYYSKLGVEPPSGRVARRVAAAAYAELSGDRRQRKDRQRGVAAVSVPLQAPSASNDGGRDLGVQLSDVFE